jgi:hypothetical protein
MTPEEMDRLEAVARKATPGSWTIEVLALIATIRQQAGRIAELEGVVERIGNASMSMYACSSDMLRHVQRMARSAAEAKEKA